MLFSWSYLKTEFKTQEETLSLNAVLKLLKTSWLKQLNWSLRYFIFKYNNTKINVLSTKPCFLIGVKAEFESLDNSDWLKEINSAGICD